MKKFFIFAAALVVGVFVLASLDLLMGVGKTGPFWALVLSSFFYCGFYSAFYITLWECAKKNDYYRIWQNAMREPPNLEGGIVLGEPIADIRGEGWQGNRNLRFRENDFINLGDIAWLPRNPEIERKMVTHREDGWHINKAIYDFEFYLRREE